MKPDLILIYRYQDTFLELVRIGKHNKVFG
ncbi:type II toxin-antitoxin system RelE/ParE family toxin [Helicobacter heilmannii]